MEIFADAFGPAFRGELYAMVAELQEKLGTVNDHVTARVQYSQWVQEHAEQPQRTVLERLIAQEAAAIQQSTSLLPMVVSSADWWLLPALLVPIIKTATFGEMPSTLPWFNLQRI